MRFVTSICYGSVTPLLSTNQKKKEKRKEKGRVTGMEKRKRKRKTFTLAALEFFFWGKLPLIIIQSTSG
jgi:hypothetical protein